MANGNGKKLGIISGSTHVAYAEGVAKLAEVPLIKREIKVFANGEIDVNITETVAGKDVFIIQTSLTGQVNDNLVETLLLADALKRSRAHSITLIQLCYPYARKDRKEEDPDTQRPKRCPISARVVADMYTMIGINRVVSYHLHAPQIVGFFGNQCPCEDIVPFRVFAEYLQKEGMIGENTVFAGPDIGSAKQTDAASSSLGLEMALIHKKRGGAVVNVDRLDVIGDVAGKDVVVYDDILDTGKTAALGAGKLKRAGAKRLYFIVTQPVLSKGAVEKLAGSEFDKIIITDNIPNSEVLKYPDKFVILSTVPMTADIIANLFNEESLEKIVKHNIIQHT